MKLAILFWFYKELDICENRLQLLKRYNPDLKIFGLYGGEISAADEYKNKLSGYLDDFYAFTASNDEDWKWINGDLMILDWYDKKGRNLDWESIAVVQWDMLAFDSLSRLFSDMKKDQIFLSGLRMIDEELENKWHWVKFDGEYRKNYSEFLGHVKEKYGYDNKPLASLFIFQIFPRIFLEKYLLVEDKEVGMLEYKIPMYSQIFNVPFYEKDIGTMWFSDEPKPLNAIPREISETYIREQLAKKDGWRIFHPYYKIWNY